MLTTKEIEEIDARLREGVTPEQIAAEMGLTYHQLRGRLLNRGKKIVQIVTMRRLESTSIALPDEPNPLALAG